tara:strand:+ start:1804 stop:2577 length:774 start_codon:yes stop_codon:yes gene_type:complete
MSFENDVKNIFENGIWYHSVNFQNVKSKGTFDYTNLVYELNLPNMKNKTVLDVGCSDGFFSKFFLEELSADSVTGVDFNEYDGSVAFDVIKSREDGYSEKYKTQNDYEKLKNSYLNLDLKDSNKFNLLKKAFELNMIYKTGSIYNLSKIDSHDITFCGSLLEHLRDPITAIEQLYFKTNDYCIIDISNSLKRKFNFFDKPLIKYTGAGGNFYHHSKKAISLIMETVGFKNVDSIKSYKIKIEKYDYKIPHEILIGYK